MILEFGGEFARDASRRCTLCYFFDENDRSFEVGVSDVLSKRIWHLDKNETQSALLALGFERLLGEITARGEAKPVFLNSDNSPHNKPTRLLKYCCTNLERNADGADCSEFGKLQDDTGCELSGSCKSCWRYEVVMVRVHTMVPCMLLVD